MSAVVGLSTAPRRRVPPTLAIALGLASVAMTGFAVVVTAPTGGPGDVGSIAIGVGLGLVGALIAYRRPRHPIGWLLLFIAVTQSFTEAASGYASYALILHPHSLPGGALAAWFGAWMWVPGVGVLVTLLLLLFPTGRLPSRRWRPVAVTATVALVLATGVLAAGTWAGRGPGLVATGKTPVSSIGFLAQNLFGIGLIVLFACMVASLGSLLVRYRRSSSEERHQLKWIAYAAVLLAATIVIDFDFVPIPRAVQDAIVAFGCLAFPASVGVSIFKFRLYGIDVVISRTLVYGGLAALITGVYIGIAVGVGSLVGGGGKPNLGLSILATAIVAVGFQPVRERLQKLVNRLVYGKRATPYEVLSQFSESVAESYASDDVLPRMARVLGEGTTADRAEVWLRRGGEVRCAAVFPMQTPTALAVQFNDTEALSFPDADRAVQVRYQGEVLGALTVTKRRGEAITPIEVKLMDDLAHQAGLVLKNVGLTADLQARLVDLRASRQRLVAAQDGERRRLERNLHDGAQQYLVAIKVKLGLAEMQAARDPEKTKAAVVELQLRLAELRASRQRLVGAQDEERRRLERNLHDGAQQHLVAIKVKLGLVEMLAARDPDKARATLVQLRDDADEALETLRDLARGIYPPLLADRGLPTALQAQARKATLPVTIEADGIGRYSQDTEAALYFCILEALQNIQKYAQASRAVVRLREDGDKLSVEVADDGRGFDVASTSRGNGLTNMEDHLDALGGTLHIVSSPGSGTTLRVILPVLTPAVLIKS
jgi:signal transduction histidine kinase